MTTTNIHDGCDFVTIVTMDVPTGKYYKVVDGAVVKTPAANNAKGWAATHHVPTAAALGALIEFYSTQTNTALILGFVQGTEDGAPYRLVSDREFRQLAEASKTKIDKFATKPIHVNGRLYASRTKRMFHASTWFGYDRDVVEGMPIELEPDADFPRWKSMLDDMIPQLVGCGYVAVKSASCRVELNGVPMANTNVHLYMQAVEANDTERFGKAGMVTSFAKGYGFMRPVCDRNTGEQIGNRAWTLYDPTTFSRERLFFEGSPIVDATGIEAGLRVQPTKAIVVDGGRVNTRSLKLPTKEEQRKLDLEIDIDNKGRVTVINAKDLTPDVMLECKADTGEVLIMSMGEFVAGDVDRYRCQSVFRPDSSSWAAFVSKEDDCEPFMYDVGTNFNYKYADTLSAFANDSDVNIVSGDSREPVTLDHEPTVRMDEGLVIPDMVKTTTLSNGNERAYIDPNINTNTNIPQPPRSRTDDPSMPAEIISYGSLHELAPEFAETDLANAQRFSVMYHNELKYVPIFGSWFKWQGHRWIKCEANYARGAVHIMANQMGKEANECQDKNSFRKWAKATASSSGLGSVLKEAASIPSMLIGVDDIDTNWYNFGVGNGYVDLRLEDYYDSVADGNDSVGRGIAGDAVQRRRLIGYKEADRNMFTTKGSEVVFNAKAKCPTWTKALFDIFSEDQELIDFFQVFVGYSMCGKPSHEVMAFFIGNGSNGKSTITGVIEKILGDYKATVDKQVLMTKRESNGQTATPALARLKGIRLAVITETREGDNIDESVVKALSGSDTITARHLHGDTFDFEATFVSWIATNHIPNIKATDEGTWRRLWFFEFKRNFLAELGREKLDVNIKQRIIDNELPGVMNWCLEGVRRYHVEGLNPPESVLKSNEQFRTDMDIIVDWMEACLEFDPTYEATNPEIWNSYKRYSDSVGDGDIIRSGRTLNKKIVSKGYKRISHVFGFNNMRGIQGFRIRQIES